MYRARRTVVSPKPVSEASSTAATINGLALCPSNQPNPFLYKNPYPAPSSSAICLSLPQALMLHSQSFSHDILLNLTIFLLGQGGTLQNFYKESLNNAPGQFIVGFGNPDDPAVNYCGYTTTCTNDGMQYLGNKLAPDGIQGKIKHKRNYYRLQGGMPFLSTRELEVGTVVKKVVKRSEGEMGLMRRAGSDPFDLVDDVVAERM